MIGDRRIVFAQPLQRSNLCASHRQRRWLTHGELTRISDFAVVPYGQDSPARLDFWGSDVGNPATEGDTLWVNYSMRRFSSRSMAS